MSFTKYQLKGYLGSLGDFETEWWTKEDWERHRKYCEELKERGELGKEFDYTITMEHMPLLDSTTHESPESPISSFEFIIFNSTNI